MASSQPIYSASPAGTSLHLWQGEILTDLIQIHLNLSSLGSSEMRVDEKKQPYAIILSQNCDLEQGYNARQDQNAPDNKKVPNILFCEAMTAERTKAAVMNSTIWNRIKINKDERYHFLQKIESDNDASGEELPELCIDFKHFFTIPTREVYQRVERGEARRRCFLVSPYLEHLSSRFAYFLSRVALPLEHVSE